MVKKKIQAYKERHLEKKQDRSIERVPRITSDNVAEHREEVLSGARKYIYPLQHSKHRIVTLSITLFVIALLVFSVTSIALLYRVQTTSNFWYQVTRVIPYPVARSGSMFVAYENYLFELSHYIHYYQNQQQLSFETEAGQAQLAAYKNRAINKVINDAYLKEYASELGVTVSDQEIDEQIRIAREQNRLGSNDEVFEDVLREFWNWSVADFRRSLETEIRAQKVLRAVDPETEQRAVAALARINAGEDFATVATEVSDDPITKEAGGDFGFVNKSNRNVAQQTVDILFRLEANEISDIRIVPYGTGYALAIVKNLEQRGDEVRGAHIIFQLKDVDEVLNERKEARPYRLYITLPEL